MLLAVGLGWSLAGAALAQSRPGGGATYVEAPAVTAVKCVRRCASKARAKEGSTLRLIGRALGSISYVTFHGTFGRTDDTYATVRPRNTTRLNVRVPAGAVSGPVSATAAAGLRSRRTVPVSILPPPEPEPNPTLTPVPGARQPGAPWLETGTSVTKAFYGSRRPVTFSFRVSVPSALQVDLIRARDGSVIQTWTPPASPGSGQSLVWNGRAGGAFAGPGRYSFRLTASGSNGALARSAQNTDLSRDSFDLYDHAFPVRGEHDFGGAEGRFGAGRGRRSHQGHDVLARCGTKMVAARGGRVQFKGYHPAAGNYLVIDGAGTGTDYVYMHLAEPTPFVKRDRVYTGQRVGSVGQTGNARGCHLHFELWSAPGWYSGGRAFNPLPALQAWDAYS